MTDEQASLSIAGGSTALVRVGAMITRRQGDNVNLLVLRGSDAVFRLPTTTADLDEAPEMAVFRLIARETSVEGVTLAQMLGVFSTTLPDDQRVLLRPAFMRTAPTADATLMRFTLTRGMRVRVTETDGEFVRAVYEEYDLNLDELVIKTRRAGWMVRHVLTNVIEHHLFHLRAEGAMPGIVQTGPLLDTAWIPLARASGLVDEHSHWLDQTRARIVP